MSPVFLSVVNSSVIFNRKQVFPGNLSQMQGIDFGQSRPILPATDLLITRAYLRARHGAKFLGHRAAHGKPEFLQLAANLEIGERFHDLRSRATMSFGLPAGAGITNQELNTKPGSADSDMVGTSGN